jgi:hypothetical protein
MMDINPEDFVMPFGKYKGETLGDIAASDPAYLDWLAGLDNLYEDTRKAVDAICEKYAAEIERAIGD